MSISPKLKIAALVPGLLALVIGLAFLFSYRVLDRAWEEGQRTKQLISSTNELNSLTHYFILYHEDRPRRQFLSEHDAMTKLISSLRFRDKSQQKLLDGIRHNSESLMKAFLRLVAAYERPAPDESYALSSEAEERLEGRVLTSSRELVSDALRLEVLIDGEIATTQRRVSWLILFVLLSTGVPLTFVLIRIMRRIFESLAILRQGTEAVGAGHLDYRIGMTARDEIGDLSRAFDLMTERLNDTTVSRDRLDTEVVERKRAEEEARQRGEWLWVILSSIGDAVIAADAEGRVSFLNPVAANLTGWEVEEARAQPIQSVFRIINEQTRRPADDILNLVLSEGKVVNLANHTALIHRDGREIAIEDSAAPIRDAEGKAVGVVIVFHDVTEKRRAQEEILEAAEKFRIVADFTYGWEHWRLPENRFAYVSPSCERITGYSREAFMQDPDLYARIIHPDDRERMIAHMREDLFQREPCELEFRIVRQDGRERWILHSCQLVTDARGQSMGRRASNRDITERKRAEEVLRESEATLRGILDATKESIWLFSPEGLVRMANKTALIRFGKPPEEVLGRHFDEILLPELAQSRLARLRETVASRQPIEFEDARSGILFHHDFYPVLDEEGRVVSIASFSRDITERKRVEDALRKAHDEMEIRVKERTSELADINEALQAEISERTRAEEIGKAEHQRLFDVLEALPAYVVLLSPEYSMPFANRFFRERFGESHGLRCYEYLFDRKEPCEGCETFTVMKTHAPHRWEWTGPDGRTYDVSDFPFTDTDGSTLIMEMGIDITERKRAEENLRSYMARLEQSNRDLEDFAHVASHDLQEPLRKIRTFSDLLIGLHNDSLNDTVRDYLDRMNLAAERMHTLVMALLRYSRITSHLESYTVFNLREPVEEAIGDLGALCEEAGARVEVGKLPKVKADRDLIRQLFQNLIGNALKYRGERKPVVRIYANASDSGLFWDIQVEDNGIGFDEIYIDKIFKPFQRLHGRSSPYKGTGMGLAICRKIVDRHGGMITARSVPGKGTKFIVSLPKWE